VRCTRSSWCFRTLRRKYRTLRLVLKEGSRRVWAASEAVALGHGGIGFVERATGISRASSRCCTTRLDAPLPSNPNLHHYSHNPE
jgi:hypothetical protein